ncbi:uncharacterized protein LOC123257698 [Drosophila ananassae]|uniref:uncharacterized protein LOC123257698 n=1 Tax=Drosophila ananassae TaxID=7217 RepID=UPI001CFFB490|nr:uncharacterized protein LOC123257698 [Drosophila ananassae]
MIAPVILLSVTFLISASQGSEESCYLSEEQEDDCAAVCYPIVKPLLRYFEKVHEKDFQIQQLQKDNAELLKNNMEVQRQLDDLNVKYAKLQSQHPKLSNFLDLIGPKISNKNQNVNDELSDLQENGIGYSQEIHRTVKHDYIESSGQITTKVLTIDVLPKLSVDSQKIKLRH